MASQDSMPPFISPGKVYNIKFGKSLVDKPRRKHDHSYQCISFDFKPISLNETKAAKLSVNHEENSLAITVPRESALGKNEAGAEPVESTLFRGPKRPCQKDFVLIWNHNSGEITLERLECTPTLKQKRTGNWPPPSTYSLTPDTKQAPPKSKPKGKTKKAASSSKLSSPPLTGEGDSHSSVSVPTSSYKHGLSGFVAGPNLESVPNCSTDASHIPPGADREKEEASDSDSDSSSSSNSSSSSSDCSDSSDEDTATHKPKSDLPPSLSNSHPPLHHHPHLQLHDNMPLSESGSDSS